VPIRAQPCAYRPGWWALLRPRLQALRSKSLAERLWLWSSALGSLGARTSVGPMRSKRRTSSSSPVIWSARMLSGPMQVLLSGTRCILHQPTTL
jgi:hypothetical protein